MVSLTALEPKELLEVLRKMGSKHASEEQIEKDIADGAPTNPDGTINIVEYAAWLVKGMSRGKD